MAAFRGLMLMTKEDILRNRTQLRKGLLKSKLFRCLKSPETSKSSGRAPESGPHYMCGVPLLDQLPTEILRMILKKLDPVWLFQAEAAYPRVADFMMTRNGNKIWYDALPAALFTVPECYQNEEKLRAALEVDRDSAWPSIYHLDTGTVNPDNIRALTTRTFFWPETSHSGFAFIPGVPNFSYDNDDKNAQVHHPLLTTNYPLVKDVDGNIRVRNLALGGPYQPFLDYRRELAGHLHSGDRCFICFEAGHQGVSKKLTSEWSMRWCPGCFAKWTVSADQVFQMDGLDVLLSKLKISGKSTFSTRRLQPHEEPQWRPLVDEILRSAVGLDFSMARAKNKYIAQVLSTIIWSQRDTERGRRAIRQEIVELAQSMWKDEKVEGFGARKRREMLEKFVTVEAIPSFLFPARRLDEEKLFLPYDPSERFLEDPTDKLKSRKSIKQCQFKWKVDQAKSMLKWLACVKYNHKDIGNFGKVVDEYNIQRLKKTATADYFLAEIAKPQAPNADLGSIAVRKRISIYLQKLHIQHTVPPGCPVLTESDSQHVKDVYFSKLLFGSCISCPTNGRLARPRGLSDMVKHVRTNHPEICFGDQDWMLVG